MKIETRIMLFNYTIDDIAKEKNIDLTSLFWWKLINEMNETICTALQNYIEEYDEEFCLLDKLQQSEFEIYRNPYSKFMPLYLDSYMAIKKRNAEYKSTYVNILSYEHIAPELDRYMQETYHSLRKENDYSREDKKRLVELRKRRTVEEIDELAQYQTDMMASNERVFFRDGEPFLLNFTSEDVKIWDKEENKRSLMFDTYYLGEMVQPFTKFPDENEIYKIIYLNKLRWEQHLIDMEEYYPISEEE